MLNNFGKLKILKALMGLELWTYIVVGHALTKCCYVRILGKKKIIKVNSILLFISIGSTSQYGDVPYHLNNVPQ